MDYVWLAVGLVLLVLGAQALVRGGVGLARRLGVSPLLIGVTIVAYGTSTPELVVSVDAALSGSSGIAVGNVVGSNIFNILAILGLSALITPIAVSPRAIYRDGGFALAAALIFAALALTGSAIATWQGLVLLALLAGSVVYTYFAERGGASASADLHAREGEEVKAAPLSLGAGVAFVAAGVGLLILGADRLVTSAIAIARDFGVSETVIGLTLVAAGTSLPELATSIVAALRRHADVAFGNVVGSNIYNILAILGVASLFGPVPIPPEIARADMWVMLAATLLVAPVMFMGWRIARPYALVFLAGYVAYTAWLFLRA